MVILKKIRSATLIEVLTASVLIVIVFMIASLSFNNVFTNQIQRDQSAVENRIKELEYLFIHKEIKIPYTEDFDEWEITIMSVEKEIVLSYIKENNTYEKKLFVR
ncbi:hypothetical protein [Aquimarina algicola]|uniref:Type II secretion system protein n=1 Tax=Aquimarina algicola TaxID=2589995 RepID=A0A504J9X7_9FLAO|nr:hypothetical protein [Aquimarina algicola]TPN87677.1 hypothetical protein FHK87_08865 [Aquimarina algicola]